MSFFNRLTRPLWPSAAVGLSGDGAALVALDRRRDALVVRRAGYVPLPAGLLRPGFDEQNVADVGAPADELRVSRRRLPADAQGRTRYLASAARLSVLAEYESAFAALGWHGGVLLPRHMGEGWWLARATGAE